MLHHLINLIFPTKCLACQQQLVESPELLCVACQYELPLALSHLNNENTVKNVIQKKINIINATSLFYFYKKGITQELLHNLKYRDASKISTYLGKWLAPYLEERNFMEGIEAVISVPLHRSRLKERGYNQVEGFAQEIAEHFSIEYLDDVLIKKEATKTQVFKNKLLRQELDPAYFELQNIHKIEGKHLLLTDDIITTGSTITTCGKILLQTKGTSLSVATMAYTI